MTAVVFKLDSRKRIIIGLSSQTLRAKGCATATQKYVMYIRIYDRAFMDG